MTCVRQPELGLSRSLHAGVRAAMRRRASSLLVCLADMPLVSPALLDTLLNTQRTTHAPAVAPDRHGQPGNPVLWSAQCYDRLLTVQGDQGAEPSCAISAPPCGWCPPPPPCWKISTPPSACRILHGCLRQTPHPHRHKTALSGNGGRVAPSF